MIPTAQFPPPAEEEFFHRAQVRHLGTPYAHSLHSYQGLTPWNPAGDKLLFAGLDENRQSTDIVVRDLSSGKDTTVGESPRCDYHTAAYQQWILDGGAVIYRDVQEGVKGSTITPVPGSTVSRSFLPRLQIRAVSADTKHGYGYSLDEPITAMRVDFSTGEIKHYFQAAEIAQYLPPDIKEDCEYSFSHFVPNADESLAFIKVSKPEPHRKRPGQMDDWGAFFVYDLHRHSFLCLGDRISGHPQWMPDGCRIVNIMQPLDGSDNRWLVIQNAITGEVRRLVDFPIEGPGHPVASPDGRFLATDAYLAHRQICPVYIIDLATRQMGEIARFSHSTKNTDTYQPGTIYRANLHPVWSPDSRRLLVNTNNGGTNLEMLVLENFLIS